MLQSVRPGPFSAVLVFAASLAACLVPTSCASFPGRLPKPAYADRLATLRADFAKQGQVVDPSLHYVPGIVKETAASDIVVDPVTGAEVVKDEYIVTLAQGRRDVDLLKAITKLGIAGELVGYLPTFNMVQFRAPGLSPANLAAIRALPFVLDLRLNRIRKSDESAKPSAPPWYIANYGIPRLQSLGKGRGTTIAVVDSGMDAKLQPLARLVVHPYSVVTASADFEDIAYTASGNVARVIDHGTRVASMANTVAPEAAIMPIQVFGWSVKDGRLAANDLMIIEGIARAIAFGADVINLSLGTDYSRYIRYGQPVSGSMDAALKTMRAISRDDIALYRNVLEQCAKRGILVVCAAGNEGLDDASVQPLVASGLTIAVGAIDREGVTAGFSNKGSLVDCFAPGVAVDLPGTSGTRFAVSGTSFSAPFVSGTLALARSAGIPLRTAEAKKALRETSFQGRLSILPASIKPVFYPVAFFRHFGARLPDEDSLLDRQYAFVSRYEKFLISSSDPDQIRLRKIMGYYEARQYAFEETEAEFKAALAIAPRQVPFLIHALAAEEAGDYVAALLLDSLPLSSDDLKAIAATIPNSDYASIVLSNKQYRACVPALHERLAGKTTEFNSNTLNALAQLADPASVGVIKDYLEARQKAIPFERGEDVACWTLARLLDSAPEPGIAAVLDRSWERYRDTATDAWLAKPYGRNIDSAATMVKAFARLRDVRGLSEAARLLGVLDGLTWPQDPRDPDRDTRLSQELRAGVEELQELVNGYLPTGLKYDHLESEGERKRMLEGIAAFFSIYSFE